VQISARDPEKLIREIRGPKDADQEATEPPPEPVAPQQSAPPAQ
jgi:hypothetical protein